jgi:transcriptional regulator with PAS, ATPase and Fis domain
MIERTYALSPGKTQITAAELPEELREASPVLSPTEVVIPESGVDMERLVSDFEHTLIRRALERAGGNKRQAADLLHVKRTTLIEKLKRLERN